MISLFLFWEKNPEKELKKGWELFLALLNAQNDDRATLENVEIVE